MSRQCCTGGAPKRPRARPFCSAAASILPAALLVLSPKCPLCLAAWLTVATGIGFSSAGVAWVRGVVVLLCMVVAACAAAPLIRRRAAKS